LPQSAAAFSADFFRVSIKLRWRRRSIIGTDTTRAFRLADQLGIAYHEGQARARASATQSAEVLAMLGSAPTLSVNELSPSSSAQGIQSRGLLIVAWLACRRSSGFRPAMRRRGRCAFYSIDSWFSITCDAWFDINRGSELVPAPARLFAAALLIVWLGCSFTAASVSQGDVATPTRRPIRSPSPCQIAASRQDYLRRHAESLNVLASVRTQGLHALGIEFKGKGRCARMGASSA